MFRGLDTNNRLILDSDPIHLVNQIPSSVPILPFKGDPKDTELIKLSIYLELLALEHENIVEANNKYFGLSLLHKDVELRNAYNIIFNR